MRSSVVMLIITVLFLALRLTSTLHAGVGVVYGGVMLVLCLLNIWEDHCADS